MSETLTSAPQQPVVDLAPWLPTTPPRPAARQGNLLVVELTNPADLLPLQEAWLKLADQAADPNVFYAPWVFLPAVQKFGENHDWKIVLVFREFESSPQVPELCGFFPFVRGEGKLRRWQWTLWMHPYCYLASPLVMTGQEAEVFKAVWEYMDRNADGALCLTMPQVASDGTLHHGIVTALRDQLRTEFVREEYARAITQYPAGEGSGFTTLMASKHVRELRRKRRKLEELGRVDFRGTPDADELDLWIDQFLKLEADGWKAQEGTAIAQDPAGPDFFRQVLKAGFEADRIRLEGLYLDDKPIAMKVLLISPPAAFAFKITFDESYYRFSPGVQLEVESLERLPQDPRITLADACSVPGHSMIDRVWPHRRLVRSLTVARRGVVPEIVVGLLPGLRAANRVVRRALSSTRRQPGPAGEKGSEDNSETR